jgi:hypothetical protein
MEAILSFGHYVFLHNPPSHKKKTAESKNFGGLAVCRAVRISRTDP